MNEAELRQFVGQLVNEALDEGLWDSIKGSLGKIGGDTAGAIKQGAQNASNYAQNVGQRAQDYARRAGQNLANTGRRIGQNISNYTNSVKQAGQMASLNADNQRIADQLEKWYQSGVFGGSKQARWAMSMLVNALNGNFNQRFGQDGVATLAPRR